MISSRLAFRTALFIFATAALAPCAQTQALAVTGVVRDSATSAPVAGAVVVTLDASGATLGRTITGERGQYRLPHQRSTVLVRALRIGYRAVDRPVPQAAATVIIDLVMATLPHTLGAVTVGVVRGCPTRPDQAQALSLLDQARAGLLATIVARERQPAELVVLRYERLLDLDGINVELQTVRIDSSRTATTSFNAVLSTTDFVNRGFRSGTPGEYTYFGPDAETLLDARFERGYCFSVAAGDSTRPMQLGLHFTPAVRRAARVDIAGTLWIDTAARALHDIEFRYIGVEPLAQAFNAGGRVGFRTLPSGIVFIAEWSLRLVGATTASNAVGANSSQVYAVQEIGGELARARWPDGQTWFGAQSSIHLTAVSLDGMAARNASLNLLGTEYRATTDSAGRATFNYVLPGLYFVAIDDRQLAPISLQIPSGTTLNVGRRSSSLARVTVPTALQHVSAMCGSNAPAAAEAWLMARVMSEGQPAAGVRWTVGNDGRRRTEKGTTGTNGLMLVCQNLRRRTLAELSLSRESKDVLRVHRPLTDALNITRIELPAEARMAVAPPAPGAGTPSVTVFGTVRDSTTGIPVSDARVTLVGAGFEGATDGTGTFVIGGLARGDYTVEVSTPWLDSIGAVTHSTVSIALEPAALELFVPSRAAILLAACGLNDSTGFVVGSVRTRPARAAPADLRVVAEWNTPGADSLSPTVPALQTSRTVRQDGVIGANGTYRVCGVPVGARVSLRTESDGTTVWAAAPRDVAIAADRPFVRIDLQLDSVPTSPTGGRPVVADALMASRRMNTLATVSIEASPGELKDFEERRTTGIGRFLSRSDLEKQRGRRLGDVLRQMWSLGSCFPKVYVDGQPTNRSRSTEPFDVNTLAAEDIEGVEFFASAASTPGRYSSPDAVCGVMLLWMRRQ